jgi:hypothetical protein
MQQTPNEPLLGLVQELAPSLASLTLVLSGTTRGLASAKPYVARRLLFILCWLSVSVRACLSHAMVMPGTHGPHPSHARQADWMALAAQVTSSGDLPTIRMSSTYTSRKSGLPCQLYKEPWVSVSGCKAATLQRLFETGLGGRLAQAIQRPAQVARRALRPCQGGIQVHVYPVHWR